MRACRALLHAVHSHCCHVLLPVNVCQCFRPVWWATQSPSRTRLTMHRSWCSPILLLATMAFLAMTRTSITYHGKKTVSHLYWGGHGACCCIPLPAVLAYVSQPRALVKTVTSNVLWAEENIQTWGSTRAWGCICSTSACHSSITNQVIVFMAHSSSETNSCSVSQEIPHLLWNPTVHFNYSYML